MNILSLLLIDEVERKNILKANRDLDPAGARLVTRLDGHGEPETFFVVTKSEPLRYFDIVMNERRFRPRAISDAQAGIVDYPDVFCANVQRQTFDPVRAGARS